MHTPSRGSIKVQLKLAHTNSPTWSSISVVGEMSNVYNLQECSSEKRTWRGNKVCYKNKSLAWMQEGRQNPSKVDLAYLETDLPKKLGRRNWLLAIILTIHYFLWCLTSIKVISHSQHKSYLAFSVQLIWRIRSFVSQKTLRNSKQVNIQVSQLSWLERRNLFFFFFRVGFLISEFKIAFKDLTSSQNSKGSG